jgi:hypothetical protein
MAQTAKDYEKNASLGRFDDKRCVVRRNELARYRRWRIARRTLENAEFISR